MLIGISMSSMKEMNIRIKIEERSILITAITDRFWFGVMATKYENITSIPPM